MLDRPDGIVVSNDDSFSAGLSRPRATQRRRIVGVFERLGHHLAFHRRMYFTGQMWLRFCSCFLAGGLVSEGEPRLCGYGGYKHSYCVGSLASGPGLSLCSGRAADEDVPTAQSSSSPRLSFVSTAGARCLFQRYNRRFHQAGPKERVRR